jgi:hypothetical protein
VFGIGRRKGGGAIRRPAALGQRADRVAQPSCQAISTGFRSTQFPACETEVTALSFEASGRGNPKVQVAAGLLRKVSK